MFLYKGLYIKIYFISIFSHNLNNKEYDIYVMQILLILVFLSSLNSDCYLIPILPSPSRINTRLVVDKDKPMNVLPMESTWNELGHLLGTQGYSGLVSEPCTQLPLIPFENYRVVVVVGWVAHKVLVTAQSPNSPFPF